MTLLCRALILLLSSHLLGTAPTWAGTPSASMEPSGDELALALRANTVRILASGRTDDGITWSETGFGFVAAERDGNCLIVTADHVARGREVRPLESLALQVAFFSEGRTRDATLLEVRDADGDIAVLEAPCPSFLGWRRDALANTRPARGTEVWFVGRSSDWYVPTVPGRVNLSGSRIDIDNLNVLPGSSGAPVMTRTGIFGILVTDASGQASRATPVDRIQELFATSNLPWQLTPLSLPTPVSSLTPPTPSPTVEPLVPTPTASAAPSPTAAPVSPTPVEMIYIPAGEFWMGCDNDEDPECEPHEEPRRRVLVASFWIDRLEVGAAELQSCIEAAAPGCGRSDSGESPSPARPTPSPASSCGAREEGPGDRPATCVTWDQAAAYCRWRGKRLPSEKEWERAARGTDGRRFPWGNGPTDGRTETTQGRGENPRDRSPAGVLDMGGSVAEWVADAATWRGQTGERLVRGGAFAGVPGQQRTTSRRAANPDRRDPTIGFRCAK